MTLDQRITQAVARAAVNWRNGDDEVGDEWAREATRLMDQRDRMCASVSHEVREDA